jgi:hypothetical protein
MLRSTAALAIVTATFACPSGASAQDNPFGSCKAGGVRTQGQLPVLIEGRADARLITFTGSPVTVTCDDTVLQANEIKYETDTRAIWAAGNVVLQQRDLTVYAERAEMNGHTKLGTFYNASGTARLGEAPAEKSPFGTLEPDVMFYGEQVAKIGERRYELYKGSFTTCVQPTPRWAMSASNATITLDKYAFLRHVVLRVKDVPLLYVPAIYYPMNKEDRSTGFLLPTYGASTLRGTSLSNAFFLVIGRSQDATFYHDWTSKSGQGASAEYRYVFAPDSRGDVRFHVFKTPALAGDDGGIEAEGRRSLQIDGRVNQGLRGGFRLTGQLNYFSDAASQQLYQDVYDSADRQQRSFSATLSGGLGRYRLDLSANQQDYFYGGNRQRNGRLPFLTVSVGDKAIGRSRIYVGGSGAMGYLVRQQRSRSGFTTATTDQSLWRFNGATRVRAPLSTLSFLTATGTASWRMTRWTESLAPPLDPEEERRQVGIGLTRNLLEVGAQIVGPTFSRIFQTPNNGYADRFKHVIEPMFSISRTSAFRDFNRVVLIDYGVDGDVGGVTQVSYGISNKVLARRVAPGGPTGTPPRPAAARQILTVDISQSYYSNALAAQYDSEYQTSPAATGTFSPVKIETSVRPSDTATGSFRMLIDSKFRAISALVATARFELPRVEVNADWSRRPVIPGLQEFGSHFLGASTTIRSRQNRLGGSYRFSYDIEDASWVQQRIMAYYNTQCCGISVDWQTMSTPLWTPNGVPTNTQFGISFTLAGIGSFSNPLGSFGGK